MINGFEKVFVFTEDIKRLLPFYTHVLGLKKQVEGGAFVVFEGGRLALGQHSQVKGNSRDTNRMIIDLNVDDCQAEYERLVGKGVKFVREPAQEPNGVTVATFLDPDGNTLQLFQWPRSS